MTRRVCLSRLTAMSLLVTLASGHGHSASAETVDAGFEEGADGPAVGGSVRGDNGGAPSSSSGYREVDGSPTTVGSYYPYNEQVVLDVRAGSMCPDGLVADVAVYRVDGPPPQRRYLHTVPQCVPATATAATAAAVVWPPLSPDAARAIIREHLPIPRVAVNPPTEGLTGLETWLWHDHDGAPLDPVHHDTDPATDPRHGLTVAASHGPYTISATVWIDSYQWDLDGTVVGASRPGTEQHPAATHTFRTKNPDSTITASTTWTGHYTWSTPTGGASGVDLGTLTIDSPPRAYPVVEVVSVPAPATG